MKNNILISIVILFIGITLGKLLNWGYFELSKQISIIESLTLFITVGLAIYVAKILEKEVQDTRIQKDLYIQKFCEIDELLNNIELMVENEDPSYNKITNKIHICGVKKDSTVRLLMSSSIKGRNVEKINKLNTKVSKNIRDLRKLLTYTDADNVITNSKIKYSNSRILEIHTKSNNLRECILELKILINLL